MSNKLSKRTEQISIDLATKNYELKSNVIRNEFNGLTKGIENLVAILPEFHSTADFIKQRKVVEALLLNHPTANNGWYTLINGQDTTYRAIEKNGQTYRELPARQYQKDWTSNKLISIADTLHWLVGSKYRLSNTETLIFGLDINLVELQNYLSGIDPAGRASASVIDEAGTYVINPTEKLIGTKMGVPVRLSPITRRLKDSISSYEIVMSPVLEIPVFRYYTPLNISSMKWTMVLDTAALNVDEDVKDIEKYLISMFISAALIILLLIAWAQAKWQKEFMLRQQAETKRQQLSIEKQELGLIAERQQKDNALLQLNALKQKVNPHFLFNSLSSLNALISKEPELAKSFVVKLSKVYRYVLESYPNGLATVTEELNFVKEYFFLQKIRFGDALEPLEIEISDEHLQEQLPFMSLQTLIENAVKHNMLSKTKPLKISIKSEGNFIVVSNNLQLRTDVKDSGKQGLNYLQSTYAYFGAGQLKYGPEGGNYKCYLPLLSFTP